VTTWSTGTIDGAGIHQDGEAIVSTVIDRLDSAAPQTAEALERVRTVARSLGLSRIAKKIIVVGGTNGKGSTVGFIESIARYSGLRVGCLTSPHIHRYNENVRIDGVEPTDAELFAAFHRVMCASLGVDPQQTRPNLKVMSSPSAVEDYCIGGKYETIPLRPFELLPLVALLLLSDAGLDLAVVEVGMGGRWDAVNVLDADLAIITTVDLDHFEFLGCDRETIGANKAGIFRRDGLAITGDIDPPNSVVREARFLKTRLIRIGHEFRICPGEKEWRFEDATSSIQLPYPRLIAPVQVSNAAVAVASLRALYPEISQSKLAAGILSTEVPGRLQSVRYREKEIFIDVGHNRQAARSLADWLRKAAMGRSAVAVYGALGDKDVGGVIEEMLGVVDRWHFCGLDEKSERGLSLSQLNERICGIHINKCTHGSLKDALDAAVDETQDDGVILAFGSFAVVSSVLTLVSTS